MKKQKREYLKASAITLIVLALLMPIGISFGKNDAITTNDLTNEFISIEGAQNLLEQDEAVLLYVQEEVSEYFDGVISLALSDLGCGGCLDDLLDNYIFIIYSEEGLGGEAYEILIGQGHNGYQLLGDITEITGVSPEDQKKFCNTLKKKIGKTCSSVNQGEKTCIQNGQGACVWVCLCDSSGNCEWKLPSKCKSGLCNGNKDGCVKDTLSVETLLSSIWVLLSPYYCTFPE